MSEIELFGLDGDLEDDPAESESVTQIIAQFAQDEDEGVVMVYRNMGGPRKNDNWLFTWSVTRFLQEGMEYLASHYLDGSYRLRICNSKRQIKKHLLINIESPKVPENIAEKTESEMERQVRELKLTVETLAKSLETKKEAPGSSMLETLSMMKMFREVMGPAANPVPVQVQQPAASSDPVALVDLALKLVSVIGSGVPSAAAAEPSGNEVIIKALEALGPMFANMATAGMQQNQQIIQDAGQVSAPQPAIVTQAPTVPAMHGAPDLNFTENNEMNLRFITKLMPLRADIIRAAAKDLDPSAYAYIIYNAFEDSEFPELLELLENPDWLSSLREIMPECERYEDWFSDLRVMLMEELAGVWDKGNLQADPKQDIKDVLKEEQNASVDANSISPA